MISSDFRQLIIWQKAMDLTIEVYSLVKCLPKEEPFSYSLLYDIRRASVTILSNIAWSRERNSNIDFVWSCTIVARCSLWELSTLIETGERLNYIETSRTENAKALITEISKMIKSFSDTLMAEN